ncbi:retrovirus-related pol polyprotein from transposon TNT 1-94 [Tanacetum coccineum]
MYIKKLKKQQIFAQKVQKQNTTLTSQLELYKERVRVLENINGDNNYLNEFLEADKRAKHFSQQAQSQFVRDRDIIRDLEKQRDKLDLDVKDYKRQNEELQKTHSILKRQMSENEDKYHDTVLDLEAKLKNNVDISLNIRDTKDTLDDASSQQKVYEKMNNPIAIANKHNCWTIDYAQINALYKDFVPQKELSAEQKYFPSSFIPSDKNSNATPSIMASMPSATPLIIELDKMKNYQLKPIVNELQFYFEFFKTLFQRDVKEMKDVFESTESELCELEKQNDFLKDQLLEVSLKHEVELSVLLNHECVDNSLHAEIEQLKKKSIEIQEGLQARIKILEKDVQRCEKQSVDFELKLQHEKEKHKWDSNLKNKNTNPLDYSWISKMEKLEDENTWSQTQTEIDKLIPHVSEKTYAYGAIRAENQNLLFTISELKTRLANVEKGMTVASSVRRPMNRDSFVKNSVLANSKKPAKKEAVYVRKNKQTDITSKNVISNKENVIDVDVANAPKAKTLLCVSYMQNVLIPCHDNFPKTRFSKESILSNSLDTTYVVSKPKIDVGSTSKANNKVSSTKRRNVQDYVGQFCDGDLEVAFCSKTCYVRNLEGDDLLTGNRESNLYTISISDMAASLPVCLMSKATSTKSWLWHRRLSHLNFGTINDLTRLDLVDGLPKFKYGKDHLCSACERGKSKKASHPLKLVPSDHSKLELLHMDLCGPMRVASINGKKYILVIVDDYSRYTWVYFLHSKDETPEIIKKFIAQAQLNYKAKVCKIRTDNGTEFKNATLKAHYEKLGIMQQFSTARTPQQNGVVERRNRTLVEAARTMLIFSRLPEFLWAEAVATACFTQNRSIIHTRHNKTPYELLRGRKPNVEYFHVFGSLCYPTNDRDDLGKMKPKADIGVFIGYSETSRGFRIYNRRTKKIMETINVKFDELTAMASEHDCLEPELQRFINHNSSAETMNTPSKEDLDNLFGPMYEEYFEKKFSDTPINSAAQPTQIHEDSPSTSSIIVDEHEAPPIVSRTHGKRLQKVGMSRKVESSKDEEGLGEDASKHGMRINVVDADDEITLVSVQDDADAEMFDVNTLTVTLAQVLAALKSVKPKVIGDVIKEPNVPVNAASTPTKVSAATTTTATILTPRKGIVITELGTPTITRSSQQPSQAKIALKLQADIDEEERIARAEEEKIDEANIAWDDIQAKVDVDYQLAERLTELVEGNEKRAGTKLAQEITKKQKVEDDKETSEIKKLMEIIPDEEEVTIDVIPLPVMSPSIVD